MATPHPGPYLLLTLKRSGGWDGDREDITPTLCRVEDADELADRYIDFADMDLGASDVHIYDAGTLAVVYPRQVEPLVRRVEEWRRVEQMRYDAQVQATEMEALRRLLAKYPDATKEPK